MNKIKSLAIIMLSMLVMSGCAYRVKVPAGYVGVKVNMYGSDKGVQFEEKGPGKYWLSTINEEMHKFPTFQQNYVWTKSKAEGSYDDESITFQTKDGLNCNADIGINYHIDKSEVSNIFQKYRKGIDEITDVYLRNEVRNALVTVASEKSIEAVYGKGKSEIIKEVENTVKSNLKSTGIIVSRVYWIGNIRLPDSVVKAINSKIRATQRAQQRENELRGAEAEAQKKIAQAKGEAESKIAEAKGTSQAKLLNAKAEAKANQLISNSLTTKLIDYEKAKRWDGKLPQFQGSATPIIDFRAVK